MELIENKNSYFEDLVSSYQKPLVRVVNNLIYSEEDAKDITQEVFIVFYNNIEKFRGESSVFTYLYRIALNKSIDYLRKNKKKRFEKEIDFAVEDDTKSVDLKIAVGEALQRLELKHRLPLILLEYEGKSYEDISKILNITLDNVKVRIYRAREALLKVFKKMGVDNV